MALRGAGLLELGRGLQGLGRQVGDDITEAQEKKRKALADAEAMKANAPEQELDLELKRQRLKAGQTSQESSQIDLSEKKAGITAEEGFVDPAQEIGSITADPEQIEKIAAVATGVKKTAPDASDDDIVKSTKEVIEGVKAQTSDPISDLQATLETEKAELADMMKKGGRFIGKPSIKARLDIKRNKIKGMKDKIKTLEERGIRGTERDEDFERKKLEREASQDFRKSEREASQAFNAGQKDIDRATTLANKKEKNLPQNMFAAASFAKRVQLSENALSALESEGFDPSTFKSRAIQKGNLSSISDPQQRRYAQAARTFVNAVLRRESGAAISPDEFTSAKIQYFAQLGDDAKTLAQKKSVREAVIAGLQAEAGPAMDKLNTELDGMQITGEAEQREKDAPDIQPLTTEQIDADFDNLMNEIK
jgi:hypothetical protein